MHNQKLLTIIEAFKTWRKYPKDYQKKVFILINHNNLRYFIDTKSLSSHQVPWTQKFSQYYFRDHYCQEKTNGVVDALSHFPQKSQAQKKPLLDENTQIFYWWQILLTKASLAKLSLSNLLSFKP